MKLLFFILLLFSNILNAEITSEKTLFTSLCIEEDSTGFKWENNHWTQTKFITSKSLYKKVKAQAYCNNTKVNKKYKDDKYMIVKWTEGCYEVGEFGAKHRRIIQCSELWNLYPNGKIKLDFISCPGIEFQPDGNFAKSNHHTQFNDYDMFGKKYKIKDSLFVSHGKCSRI